MTYPKGKVMLCTTAKSNFHVVIYCGTVLIWIWICMIWNSNGMSWFHCLELSCCVGGWPQLRIYCIFSESLVEPRQHKKYCWQKSRQARAVQEQDWSRFISFIQTLEEAFIEHWELGDNGRCLQIKSIPLVDKNSKYEDHGWRQAFHQFTSLSNHWNNFLILKLKLKFRF